MKFSNKNQCVLNIVNKSFEKIQINLTLIFIEIKWKTYFVLNNVEANKTIIYVKSC